MPTTMELSKCDLILQWELIGPVFELLAASSPVLRCTYARLKQYGLQTKEMRVQYGETGNVGTISLDCRLTDVDVLVRFGLERLDTIALDCLRVPTSTVFGIALDASRALKDTSPEVTFKSFSIALGLHGLVPQKSALAVVQQYLAMKPDKEIPLTGVGLNLQFGPHGDALSSSLLAEPSLVIPGGLYVKAVTALDGKRVTLERVPEVATSLIQRSLGLIGLAANVF